MLELLEMLILKAFLTLHFRSVVGFISYNIFNCKNWKFSNFIIDLIE